MKPQRVARVEPVEDYILRITFADRSEYTLDLWPMIAKSHDALHSPLHSLDEFRKVSVNGLTIEWPTGLDICPDGLRRWCEAGRVLHEESAFPPEMETAR